MVAEPVLLRAELRVDKSDRDRVIIGHTIRVSDIGCIVQTDADAPLGARVLVELSLPGSRDERWSLEAELVARRIATGPGAPATWELGWAMSDRRDLEAMLERLGDTNRSRHELRILLVEDSRMVRQVFELGVARMIQSRCGPLTLDCAEDGERGWDRLCSADYDVAIIDCLLPGIPGPELIRRVRSDDKLQRLPVVAISVGGEAQQRWALEAGADVFVHKPIAVRDLLTTIERLTVGGQQ